MPDPPLITGNVIVTVNEDSEYVMTLFIYDPDMAYSVQQYSLSSYSSSDLGWLYLNNDKIPIFDKSYESDEVITLNFTGLPLFPENICA